MTTGQVGVMEMLRQLTNPLGLQLVADDEVLRLAGMATGSCSSASRDSRLHRNLVLVAEIERKLAKIRISGSVPFGFLPGNALHFSMQSETGIFRQLLNSTLSLRCRSKQANFWRCIGSNVDEVIKAHEFVVLKWFDMATGVPCNMR